MFLTIYRTSFPDDGCLYAAGHINVSAIKYVSPQVMTDKNNHNYYSIMTGMAQLDEEDYYITESDAKNWLFDKERAVENMLIELYDTVRSIDQGVESVWSEVRH